MFSRSSLMLLCLFILSTVSAHAFFVTGNLSTTPMPAPINEAFTLQIQMTDPSGAPVEDAIVAAEFSKGNHKSRFDFSPSNIPGLYSANVTLPEEGTYSVLLRDTTYRAEEAKATIEFTLGEGQPDTTAFIFPPTRTSSSNLSTWLIWVIGIPVLAGIIVTVLVLMNTKEKTTEESETKQV
ncbi:MAG: FixH family protein [Trueperaceae bacterium]